MSRVMDDRRQSPRTQIPYRLDLVDSQGELLGYVSDISTDGARVMILEGDLDGIETLRIQLPAWIGLDPEVQLGGRFVWRKPTPDGIEGGFLFASVGRRDRDLLAELTSTLEHAFRSDTPAAG